MALVLTASLVGAGASIAAAQPAPPAASGADPIGPDVPTEQRSECAAPQWSGADPMAVAPAQGVLDLPRAHEIATGRGQRVAVIDTGVQPGPRLRSVTPGGDYVSNGNGLQDCDGHGTLIAGIIAATDSSDDAFQGVAPDAEILAIRQASIAFQPKDRDARSQSPGVGHGYGNVTTLARAVHRAVDLGASVINVSQVACGPSVDALEDGALGAAVRRAAEQNIVVVVAAGNLQSDGPCRTQNPAENPGNPAAGTADLVNTYVTPARFDDAVLAVGSVSPTGRPAAFSLAGPWVGVSAPGTDIVSLGLAPDQPLTDRQETDRGLAPYLGTSFSTAYVAGLAALLREQHPEWSARQVIDRITRTAHGPQSGPNPVVGAGAIDIVAALTEDSRPATAVVNEAFDPGPPDPGPNPVPRRIAAIGGGILFGALIIGAAISLALRREPNAVVTTNGTDDSF